MSTLWHLDFSNNFIEKKGVVIHILYFLSFITPLMHLNLLKPTGHVMHHQFNIQQLYAVPTLYLYVLYLSENRQWLVPLTAQTDWFL